MRVFPEPRFLRQGHVGLCLASRKALTSWHWCGVSLRGRPSRLSQFYPAKFGGKHWANTDGRLMLTVLGGIRATPTKLVP